MPFVPMTDYSSSELLASVDLDGPCLMNDGAFALFVSLRGKHGFVLPNADCSRVVLGARDREPLEAIEDLIAEWPDRD